MEPASYSLNGQIKTALRNPNPDVSSDGRYVGFASWGSNIVENSGQDGTNINVFVRDMIDNQTLLVSVNGQNQIANKHCTYFRISGNGRYVVFVSAADNLTANDTNNLEDVFVRDLETKVTTRISLGLNGIDANGNSGGCDISYDGRLIVFDSDASNLIPNDLNGAKDTFVYDSSDGSISLCSIAEDGKQATTGVSSIPSISGDGQYVAFSSDSSNLVTGDINGKTDIYRIQLVPISVSSFEYKGNILLQQKDN